jgi:hypothetical protein
MSERPEALLLADQLGARYSGFPTCDEAAAELRRLHALNGELLGALKGLSTAPDVSAYGMALHNARAAIAKAEGKPYILEK